jgi:hypothetical protein
MLVKITAVIVIIAILIVLVARYLRARDIKLKYLFFFIILIIIINIPWVVYKNKFIISGFSINNNNLLSAKPLVLDDRLNFFLKFDADIFEFPYWYSGGRGFWSMFFADSFYDYYGTIENKDYVNYFIEHDSKQLVRTTHLPSYVTIEHRRMATIMVYLGVVMSLFVISGIFVLLINLLREKSFNYLFYSLIVFGFLTALLYSSYRYPYYDHGIVKSIFIFPFYLFPIWSFFELAKRKKFLSIPVFIISMAYIIFLVRYYLITNFGY